MANEGSRFWKNVSGSGGYNSMGYPTASGQLLERGKLAYIASNVLRPMSYYTGSGTAVLDQADLADKFAGVIEEGHATFEANTGRAGFPETGLRVLTDVNVIMDCAAGQWEPGDLCGVVSAGGGLQGDVSDVQVAKVTHFRLAIGYCLERYSSNTTKVPVRLFGWNSTFRNRRMLAHGLGNLQQFDSATLADSNVTLTVGSAPVQVGTPTAARDVTLPAVSLSKGLHFYVINNSGGANSLTVKNAGGTTIGTVAQNKRGVFFCDGATWFGIVGA